MNEFWLMVIALEVGILLGLHIWGKSEDFRYWIRRRFRKSTLAQVESFIPALWEKEIEKSVSETIHIPRIGSIETAINKQHERE